MSKVYVITSGCYSDYGIRGVSLNKKSAQAAIDAAKIADEYWARDAEIEAWEADELLTRKVQTVYFCGMLLDDGSIVEPKNSSWTSRLWEKPFRGEVTQYGVKVPVYNNRPIVRTRSTVSAAHAQKLAAEKRQEWLRNGGKTCAI